mgnify:CR=1 FL=1
MIKIMIGVLGVVLISYLAGFIGVKKEEVACTKRIEISSLELEGFIFNPSFRLCSYKEIIFVGSWEYQL